MLYTYPLAATEHNWLHNCLVEMLETVHREVAENVEHTAWPDSIPLCYRDKLKTRRGLRDRLIEYIKEYTALNEAMRETAHQSLITQNQIEDLLNTTCDATTIDGHTSAFCLAVKDLLKFCFRLLSDLSIRDEHYKIIYNATNHHVCPFCGLDRFDAPQAPRHSLDHYLASSRYPFAGANLRNLVPMCDRCNESYKCTDDVLHKDGYRRMVFDPYLDDFVTMSLLNSNPTNGCTADTPDWVVEFTPEFPQIETWDDVFNIRERYVRDHLNDCFFKWLGEFFQYCKSLELDLSTDIKLIRIIARYIELKKYPKLRDREFLKAAVFEFLYQECRNGNKKIITLFRNRL